MIHKNGWLCKDCSDVSCADCSDVSCALCSDVSYADFSDVSCADCSDMSCADCNDVSCADFVRKDENKTLYKQTVKHRKVRVSCNCNCNLFVVHTSKIVYSPVDIDIVVHTI